MKMRPPRLMWRDNGTAGGFEMVAVRRPRSVALSRVADDRRHRRGDAVCGPSVPCGICGVRVAQVFSIWRRRQSEPRRAYRWLPVWVHRPLPQQPPDRLVDAIDRPHRRTRRRSVRPRGAPCATRGNPGPPGHQDADGGARTGRHPHW